jgi:transposase
VIVQGTSVGLDVHALSVVAHAVDEETGEIARARLCPDHGEILGWLHQLRAPVRVTYEAGPTGFGLARAITEAGMECLVAAPSKLQRPAGDRIKTDLLTELSASSPRGCVRGGVRLARFAAREQRCGCAAGVVRAGGAAAGFAGGDGRAVRAVSAC